MKKILVLALSLFLAGCMVTKTSETSSSYQTITSTEAQKMIEENKDVVILDVRTADEYASDISLTLSIFLMKIFKQVR